MPSTNSWTCPYWSRVRRRTRLSCGPEIQGASKTRIAILYTCRTCAVQPFGISGTDLGRAAGRDRVTAINLCIHWDSGAVGTQWIWSRKSNAHSLLPPLSLSPSLSLSLSLQQSHTLSLPRGGLQGLGCLGYLSVTWLNVYHIWIS